MHSSKLLICMLTIMGGMFLAAGVAHAQTTWYVDDDCVPPGSGTPEDPFCLIQDGIDAAEDGDTVQVADGTYLGDGNRDLDFGGKLITVRSANGPDTCVIDCEGSEGDPHRGFIFQNAETEDAVLEGFTITGGHHSNGGGVYCPGGNPTVTNCTFDGNSATTGGGMACFNHSSPTVTNCTFSENSASDDGAGMYNADSSPTVTNCTFSGNSASDDGGGMGNLNSNPTVTDCMFSGNEASGNSASTDGGGGMYNDGSSPTITSCTFESNFAQRRGGGMHNIGNSSTTVTNCTFTANATGIFGGGGMSVRYGAEAAVINCLFQGNQADNHGGAIVVLADALVQIHNCTIVQNAAGGQGGGVRIAHDAESVTVSNSILWNNAPQQIAWDGGLLSVTYSDIQGGWAGEGNINADPQFPIDGVYIPGVGSQCIDAGDNTAVPEGIATDLDGYPRFVDVPCVEDGGNPPGADAIVDMGAYEFQFDNFDCNDNRQPDICDIVEGTSEDCNTNSVPDECDIADGISEDCTDNGVPDECEPDCNENGQTDSCDIADGSSEDCNANSVPDECDIDEGSSADCNANAVPDECDIADGTSEDCNANGAPDECEPAGLIITSQPMSQEVDEGGLAFFSVGAEGISLEYQWRKDGADLADTERIIGSTTATLVILDVQASDAGEYDCVVTDIFGCTKTSEVAVLTVIAACPADLDGDGLVNITDLLALLGSWGDCPGCRADFDGDGTVSISDLLTLLAAWGPCI